MPLFAAARPLKLLPAIPGEALVGLVSEECRWKRFRPASEKTMVSSVEIESVARLMMTRSRSYRGMAKD